MSNVIFIFLRRMRRPLILLVLVYAVATFGLTIVPGQDSQGLPHFLNFFHAFYFVSFMGSTIGFGEIPYPFTDAQRVWVLVSIYTSVVAWLYTIGSLLTLFQDPAFKHAITFQTFRNTVKRQTEPFWIICGLGNIGHAVIERLVRNNVNVVVIDYDQNSLSTLELADYGGWVPALMADVTVPENLVAAGIAHPDCEGVIALANDDTANLKIAITANQLRVNPNLKVICRSENEEVARNMESFGTNVVLNPFEIFSNHLGLAIHSPQLHTLGLWLTDNGEMSLTKGKTPPTGRWVVCGYGQLGKSLETILGKRKIDVTIIDPAPRDHHAPASSITGLGTEATTLIEANLATATGLVAATADDADNLSIIMTAKELCPSLFTIARLNSTDNEALFSAAKLDLVMRRDEVLADRILAIVDRPLVTQFLRLAHQLSKETVEHLMTRIETATGNNKPISWRYTVGSSQTPAFNRLLAKGTTLMVADLTKQANRQSRPAIPLLVVEDGKTRLLPEPSDQVSTGQQYLFCGSRKARRNSQWLCEDAEFLDQILHPDRPSIPLIQWLSRIQEQRSPSMKKVKNNE